MTFTELLKQEEEKLTEDLRRAASPEKARAVAADAWERLLYRWQEGQEEKKLIEPFLTFVISKFAGFITENVE